MTADAYQINKVLGFLLGAGLFLQAVHIADGMFKPASEVAVKARQTGEGQAGGAASSSASAQSFGTALASASADHGAQVAKQCEICHNLQEGQGNKVGPNLYGVVGRPVASVAGFNYSSALKAKGGTWTFDALNAWLTNPRTTVPGTSMTFAGLSNEKQRADLVAYLDTLSKDPVPLPKANSEK